MEDPKPIGEIIDEAMAEILGATGSWYYAELVRQTRENRERIEREVRSRFQAVFAEVYAELTGFQMDPQMLETSARTETDRRLQAEIVRRIGEEEQLFRGRLARLCARLREQKPPGRYGSET
jgi:hypothetical protein